MGNGRGIRMDVSAENQAAIFDHSLHTGERVYEIRRMVHNKYTVFGKRQ